MLKKLAILFLAAVALTWAVDVDVSVDSAGIEPFPAVLNQDNAVGALVSNNAIREVHEVLVSGIIGSFDALDTLLFEDFEGDWLPTGWDTVLTNNGTDPSHHFWNPNLWDDMHNGVLAPGVWANENGLVANEWLITPNVDLSDYGKEDIVTLSFYASFIPSDLAGAHTFVCLSTDGGSTWSDTLMDLIHDIGEAGDPQIWIGDELNPFEVDLSFYLGDTITIGFNAAYAEGVVAEGPWTVDDVAVIVDDYASGWSATDVIASINPGETALHIFMDDPWSPTEAGSYRLTVWAEAAGDEVPENNTFSTDIYAGVSEDSADLAMLSIVYPQDVVAPNEAFIPQCMVANYSNKIIYGADVTCNITIGGIEVYRKVLITTFTPDTFIIDGFPPFTTGDPGSEYMIGFLIDYAPDTDSTNNYLSKPFLAAYPHAIVPVEVIEPEEGKTYEAGSIITPTAIYENIGTETENDWYATVYQNSVSGFEWHDTVHVTSELAPGEQITIYFPEITLHSFDDDYTTTFSCYMNIEDFSGGDLGVGFKGEEDTGIEESIMPNEYALAVSNKIFSRDLTIQYSMPRSGHVSLKLYDVTGQLLESLVDAPVPAGYSSLDWDGREMPTGLYFLRMETSGFTATRKLVLVR